MFSFPLELLERAWPRFLSAIGTTGLGFFISAIEEFFVTLILTHIVILAIRGSAAMRHHAAQNLTIGLIVFVIAFPILWGPAYYHQLTLAKDKILEESNKIVIPLPRPPSLPANWNVKFMQPFCYVLADFNPLRLREINGRIAFPLRVWSDVVNAWHGVHVRVRRPDRLEYLVDEEVGTLRRGYSGSGTYLNQLAVLDFDQPYWVIILTEDENFQEVLTVSQTNGHLEEQIQIYRFQEHGSPILLFDSVAQGRLP